MQYYLNFNNELSGNVKSTKKLLFLIFLDESISV
jgi:hypothetical protein